jgi:nitroreductase
MKVADAIRARRAVKYFDPQHRMPAELRQRLLEQVACVPSAFNLQHWRIVEVADPALRQALRLIAGDQPQLTDASLLLILCFDRLAWDRDPEHCWRLAPGEVRSAIVSEIRRFYGPRASFQRDEGHRSCGILAQTLMLAAQELGYDSCPLDGFDFERAGELIRLPADHEISLMLAIGKALQPAHPRPGPLSLDQVLVIDRFPATPAAAPLRAGG